MSNGINWDRYDAPDAPPQTNQPYHKQATGYQGYMPMNDQRAQGWLDRQLSSPAVKALWQRRRHTITSIFIAVVLALCIAIFGFGYTLLGAIFVAIAYIYGGWRDGNPIVYALLSKFL
ncbi:DUF2273 domain-containing protein [Peptococcus simiae]|uniref:DUF2273 domain-containing protein n=1 Tax=Peptococcus simiae TaxID=1643805 RepID=UPI00397F0B9D